MTKTDTLNTALHALAVAERTPSADCLEELISQYPEHADALTDMAIELALDAMTADEPVEQDTPDAGEVSPAVSRAISHYQNIRFGLETKSLPVDGSGRVAAPIANPFQELERSSFKEFTTNMDVNTTFVMRLRDRQITPESIPVRFTQDVAEHLNVSVELLAAHFSAPAAISAGQHFKSESKPVIQRQQDFEQAVENSGLTIEQQEMLLNYLGW